ncbi:DNA sulfur modification protein DndD [Amphritea sp. 1_MG-2023]|uniref:DNA sulfur modification protein DndD n=1 Tax=Amphritea sp. 1_MG-2023 TaxID=3062670 RepID=UPI0026E2C6BF|nr:DNA sulfur modification protein DndD [Amphritea sp. 1_MG-2023]MDO6562650.1 DNA sulfur modification protein DndD [Amphritea sp. 1_MG-2023]
MILNQLKLRDFGVFSGEHSIDLAPRDKSNHKRPIILFGGLNGAGKTTTLTSIRLALYGRLSLGRSITIQAYHVHLKELIHRPKDAILAPYTASVGLSFTYGKHGSLNEYKVVRSWAAKGEKVIEHLEIHKDDELLKGLSGEQLQSFLNELIPIGVADLFFFDGEKIADLAEDENNEALADAINRLLGLDIIDRLRADLGIYLRDHTQSKLPKDISQELKAREKRYEASYAEYQNILTSNNELSTQLSSVEVDIEAINQRINDLGGAWAKSRQGEELRTELLIKERNTATSEMKELFADTIPLALAPKAIASLLTQLKTEKDTKAQLVARKAIKKQLKKLRNELSNQIAGSNKKDINQAIENTFSDLLDDRTDTIIRHDLSDSDYDHIYNLIHNSLPQQQVRLKKLGQRVEEIEQELETAATNIARAPEQSRLDDVLAELAELQEKKGALNKEISINLDNAKRSLREAMEHLRRLRELNDKYSKSMSQNQAIQLAVNSRRMLSDFGERTKQRKLAILEQEFIKSFSKLARKDDMDLQAHIDANTFNVTLTDKHGNSINKKRLSAGEKQIFAIAMLEALGRTSGRSLPIIIDTPLGRLDSEHRTKLVKNYFPTASHQVLILSTDTEVDEDFYTELSPEISHAFSVDYDTKQGCSQYNEGYFWQQ